MTASSVPKNPQVLITRLEEFSRQNPAGYRFRVMLVAALGYAYLFAVVLGLLVAIYLAIWAMIALGHAFLLKLVWIPLVLAWLVLKSMWITIPPPDGKEIQPEQAPALFDLIAGVQASLAGPHVHHVLLSDEFNAGIVQVPKFGMFGWTTNYLVVGLQLLKAIGPDEFRAVIAHEFGHLSGKHGKFSGWIYRIRQSWIQVLANVQQERHYASFIFEWFINWYAPYFNAYSFVLARAQEYEADGYAVETSGKKVTARMLVQMEIKARALQEELWPKFYEPAGDQPQTPKNPFGLMLAQLEQPLAPVKIDRWLRQSLRVSTGYDDTHPALAERLAGIGFTRDAQAVDGLTAALDLKNGSSTESAAERFLKEVPAEVTESYDRLWRESVVNIWTQTHEYVQQARKRLAELEEIGKSRPLTIDEQWERARCTADAFDSNAAVPLAREILQQEPDHVGANFALGATLLEQSDPDGVGYLQKAVELKPSFGGDAYELLYNFYQAQGEQAEANKYREYADEFYARQVRLHEEALNLTVHDRFEPHDLDDVALKFLREQLAKTRGLGAAYLVRKMVEGTEPLYVLAVLASYTWKDGQSGKYVDDLIDELASNTDLAKPTVFVSLDVKAFLTDTITRIPKAEVWVGDPNVGVKSLH